MSDNPRFANRSELVGSFVLAGLLVVLLHRGRLLRRGDG